MERTASGKTNVIPYSQYRKSRLDSIRNDLGLQGKSATRPYDSCVLVYVAVGYGSGTSLPIFRSLGYRLQSKSCLDSLSTNLGLQGAPHAYTLVHPVWILKDACKMNMHYTPKVLGCLPTCHLLHLTHGSVSALAVSALRQCAHVGGPGGQRDGVSGAGGGANTPTAGGLRA